MALSRTALRFTARANCTQCHEPKYTLHSWEMLKKSMAHSALAFNRAISAKRLTLEARIMRQKTPQWKTCGLSGQRAPSSRRGWVPWRRCDKRPSASKTSRSQTGAVYIFMVMRCAHVFNTTKMVSDTISMARVAPRNVEPEPTSMRSVRRVKTNLRVLSIPKPCKQRLNIFSAIK